MSTSNIIKNLKLYTLLGDPMELEVIKRAVITNKRIETEKLPQMKQENLEKQELFSEDVQRSIVQFLEKNNKKFFPYLYKLKEKIEVACHN